MSIKTRELTCIVCPRGCQLSVSLDGDEVISVSDNICKRGADYAQSECTSPTRTVTTTVRCESGRVISVKTGAPVPKNKVFEVMKEVNNTVAPNGLKIGDVVIKNVAGTGVDILATSNY
ncbi:MAG: DUF1667 domain-containing protein [Clostridia bacterium]|nr:DUF1667 domain-containing protein [Clostridia bacterium]